MSLLLQHKKQRIEARSQNLKGKDVHVIIAELERLDQIQYSVEEAPKLNPEVIENKRKKLKETLTKIMSMYKKEDQATFDQIRRLEMNYEGKRANLIKRYEAVISAKQVNLEEIPLPAFAGDDLFGMSASSTSFYRTSRSSTSSSSEEPRYHLTISGEVRSDLKPPGCPALVPPSIEQLEEELRLCGKSLDSVNAEKDLDEFLKEVDRVEKQISTKEQTTAPPAGNPLHSLPSNRPIGLPPPIPMLSGVAPPNLPKPPAAALNPPSSSSLPNPINPVPFPVLLNPMGLLNPPPPQIKRPPPTAPPPSFKHPLVGNPHFKFNAAKHAPTVAAVAAASGGSAQIRREPEKSVPQQGATIEAKPQLRNLSADVTKFLPTSLRIKRQETTKKPVRPNESTVHRPPAYGGQSNRTSNAPASDNRPNKDAAYEEFMKELSGLI